MAPYPAPTGVYPDPNQAPPPGFNMGYNSNVPPVMYQPGPVGPGPVPGPEYGAPKGPAPGPEYGGAAVAPVVAPVGVPPGLEYLTQVGQRQTERRDPTSER